MRTVFIIFLVLLAPIVVEAQISTGNFREFKPLFAAERRQENLKRDTEKWGRDFNRKGRTVVVARFDGFLTLPSDLEQDLSKAFPEHRFTIEKISVLHKGREENPRIFLTRRRGGRILAFSYNPLTAPVSGWGAFADFLTFYPAKDEADALFKVKTLARVFLLPISGRIGSITRENTGISALLCHGVYSIEDLGIVL